MDQQRSPLKKPYICKIHGALSDMDVAFYRYRACRICTRKKATAWKEQNREKILSSKKKYRENSLNKEKHIKYLKEYRAKNRVHNNANKRYYEKNKEIIKKKYWYCNRNIYKQEDVRNGADWYIKELLTRGTILEKKDIPKTLIEAKRFQLALSREAKKLMS